MRVLQLSLRNYRVFEEVDLELPSRVIGIFGPNGAGKSALVESLLFGLYGRARTDRKHIRTQGVLTDCAVRVAFEHGGQQYVVRRSLRGKGHQTEAELLVGDLVLATGVTEVDSEIRSLLRMDQQVFRASVFAEQKQLDAFSDVTPGRRKDMVMRLLGIKPVEAALVLSRKEARRARGNADQLSGTLPDLEEAEAELEAAREQARAAEERARGARQALDEASARATEATAVFGAAEELRERVEKLEIDLRGRREVLERSEAQREELATHVESLSADLAAAPALEEERAALEGTAERLDAARRLAEVLSEMDGIGTRLTELAEADAEAILRDLEAAGADRDAAAAARVRAEADEERARRELMEAREALTRADQADPSQPCPTCGRPLGDDFREYVAHCRARVEEAGERAERTAVALKAARTASRAAERTFRERAEAGEEARRAAAERRSLEARSEEARRRADELAGPFDGAPPDMSILEADARRAGEVDRLLAGLEAERKHLARAHSDLERLDAELERVRGLVRALEREAAGLAFDPEEHARLRKEAGEATAVLEEARQAERAAADALATAGSAVRELQAGIRKVKEMAARVRDLREEARLLDRVSQLMDGFRDHLVARIGPELSREAQALFRELTNAEYDDLRIDEESLAIQIADGTDYFAVERFSGSEADLANLALRVAISLHLSRMSGADVGMMVLDEVLGSLDAERKDLFVRTMGRLSNHLHQLFVITHAEQVKDQFPAAIEVRKVARRRSVATLV